MLLLHPRSLFPYLLLACFLSLFTSPVEGRPFGEWFSGLLGRNKVSSLSSTKDDPSSSSPPPPPSPPASSRQNRSWVARLKSFGPSSSSRASSNSRKSSSSEKTTSPDDSPPPQKPKSKPWFGLFSKNSSTPSSKDRSLPSSSSSSIKDKPRSIRRLFFGGSSKASSSSPDTTSSTTISSRSSRLSSSASTRSSSSSSPHSGKSLDSSYSLSHPPSFLIPPPPSPFTPDSRFSSKDRVSEDLLLEKTRYLQRKLDRRRGWDLNTLTKQGEDLKMGSAERIMLGVLKNSIVPSSDSQISLQRLKDEKQATMVLRAIQWMDKQAPTSHSFSRSPSSSSSRSSAPLSLSSSRKVSFSSSPKVSHASSPTTTTTSVYPSPAATPEPSQIESNQKSSSSSNSKSGLVKRPSLSSSPGFSALTGSRMVNGQYTPPNSDQVKEAKRPSFLSRTLSLFSFGKSSSTLPTPPPSSSDPNVHQVGTDNKGKVSGPDDQSGSGNTSKVGTIRSFLSSPLQSSSSRSKGKSTVEHEDQKNPLQETAGETATRQSTASHKLIHQVSTSQDIQDQKSVEQPTNKGEVTTQRTNHAEIVSSSSSPHLSEKPPSQQLPFSSNKHNEAGLSQSKSSKSSSENRMTKSPTTGSSKGRSSTSPNKIASTKQTEIMDERGVRDAAKQEITALLNKLNPGGVNGENEKVIQENLQALLPLKEREVDEDEEDGSIYEESFQTEGKNSGRSHQVKPNLQGLLGGQKDRHIQGLDIVYGQGSEDDDHRMFRQRGSTSSRDSQQYEYDEYGQRVVKERDQTETRQKNWMESDAMKAIVNICQAASGQSTQTTSGYRRSYYLDQDDQDDTSQYNTGTMSDCAPPVVSMINKIWKSFRKKPTIQLSSDDDEHFRSKSTPSSSNSDLDTLGAGNSVFENGGDLPEHDMVDSTSEPEDPFPMANRLSSSHGSKDHLYDDPFGSSQDAHDETRSSSLSSSLPETRSQELNDLLPHRSDHIGGQAPKLDPAPIDDVLSRTKAQRQMFEPV